MKWSIAIYTLLVCSCLFAKPSLTEQVSSSSTKMAALLIKDKKLENANYFLNFALALDSDNQDALLLQGRQFYGLPPKGELMTAEEQFSFISSLKSIGQKQSDKNRKTLFYLLHNLLKNDDDVLVYLQAVKQKNDELNIYKLLDSCFKYKPENFSLIKGVEAKEEGESGTIRGKILQKPPTYSIRPPKTKDLWWIRWKDSGEVMTHNTNCRFYLSYEKATNRAQGGKGAKGINCPGCGGSKPASWNPNYYVPHRINEGMRLVQLLYITYDSDKRRYTATYRVKHSIARLTYERKYIKPTSQLFDKNTLEKVDMDKVFKRYLRK